MFVTSWVAVAWHRFILLEEPAGLLPGISGRPIWSYLRKSIMLGLLIVLIAIPVMFIFGAAMVPAMGPGGETSAILPLVIGAVAYAISSALSPCAGLSLCPPSRWESLWVSATHGARQSRWRARYSA